MSFPPPRILTLPPTHLVGMRRKMSMAQNETRQLWQGFMPRRKKITHRVDQKYLSLQVFPAGVDFASATITTVFEKWAAVAVSNIWDIPEGMEVLNLEPAEYAIFLHKGTPQTFPQTREYILRSWLPTSGYEIDDRPQFEVLEEGYNPMDPEAEEEIWIPIK
ncbi:MAG: GyrI-like domain-containing protein [Bacteroidota bacterium]